METKYSSSAQNRTSGPGGHTMHCHPFPNVRFEILDSSIPYFVNAALNVPLAVATTSSNLVVLLAIRHVTSIRLPSKLLLCSLMLTDLGAGSVVQPQWAAFLFHRAMYPDLIPCAVYKSFVFTGTTFSSASLFTLAAINLDRYAAFFFHLKYHQIVTTRRICLVLAFIWALALLLALASLLDRELWHAVGTTVSAIALIVVSVACIKIYRRLRAQQIQPQAPNQAQQQAGNTLNMARYRRTASAMMLIYVLLMVCYVPFWCAATFRSATEKTALSECLWDFSYSLVLLNSLLNPFVYLLRLPEFRSEVARQLHKLFCRFKFSSMN